MGSFFVDMYFKLYNTTHNSISVVSINEHWNIKTEWTSKYSNRSTKTTLVFKCYMFKKNPSTNNTLLFLSTTSAANTINNMSQAVFEQINDRLEEYYKRLNCDYRSNAENGVFLQYCIDEELIDEELPINAELGDECSATDCAYTWLYHRYYFPVPNHLYIPSDKMEQYIFYVLKHCHKFNQAPSDSCMIASFANIIIS